MNLLDAAFRRPLRIVGLTALSEEAKLLLVQLGLEAGEEIKKIHSAPLGDPHTIQIGEQHFSLRADVCEHIEVEYA